MHRVIVCSFAAAGFATGVARADNYYDHYDQASEKPRFDSYAWNEPGMKSNVGISASLGAGYGQFTDNHVTDVTSTGQAGWSFRVALGTHIPLGFEAAYVGTVSNLDSSIDSGASLLGTGFEGAVRWNVLPHFRWNPFVFAGVGYQRYDITNLDISLADTGISDSDHLAVYPLGAGLSYRGTSGLVFDVRGTYRAAQRSDLIVTTAGEHADLDTWDVSAALGYEL